MLPRSRLLGPALAAAAGVAVASGIALALGPRWAVLRGAHAWSASATLVLALLVAASLYAAGSVPRKTLLGGAGVLGLLLAAYESGAILPWDQRAWEAWLHVREAASIVGIAWGDASDPASAPLTAVLVVHALVLPFALALLVVWLRPRVAGPPWVAASVAVCLVALGALWPPRVGPAPVVGLAVSRPHWPFLWIVPLERAWGSAALWAPPALLGIACLLALATRTSSPWVRRVVLAALALPLLVLSIAGMR